MAFQLSSFKSALGVAARPNNFYVTMTFPQNVTANFNENIRYLCKTAAIPAFTVGVVEIPHIGGRKMKVPGDRTFAEWTATFIADEGMVLHKDMEAWLQYIKNSNYSEAGLSGSTNSIDYQGTINVLHTGQDGVVVRNYTLENAFPTEIAQLDLSYDNFDTIAEYSVTFQYSHLKTSATEEDSAAGSTDTGSADGGSG